MAAPILNQHPILSRVLPHPLATIHVQTSVIGHRLQSQMKIMTTIFNPDVFIASTFIGPSLQQLSSVISIDFWHPAPTNFLNLQTQNPMIAPLYGIISPPQEITANQLTRQGPKTGKMTDAHLSCAFERVTEDCSVLQEISVVAYLPHSREFSPPVPINFI